MGDEQEATRKVQEQAPITANERIGRDTYRLDLAAPAIAVRVQPGQFVHVRIPGLTHRLLRRPFSVCDTDSETGRLTIVYKVVGEGTRVLSRTEPGAIVDLLGPLGCGFSIPDAGELPVIVAGGYGAAATYLLARRSPCPPLVMLGGRTAEDLLLLNEFRALGCEIRIATEDGSAGRRGVVTDLLEDLLDSPPSGALMRVYACGPTAMLGVVARIVGEHGMDAEISLDHVMCCGVGACYTCVVKVRADTPDGWEYVRTCIDGPVFLASETVWD